MEYKNLLSSRRLGNNLQQTLIYHQLVLQGVIKLYHADYLRFQNNKQNWDAKFVYVISVQLLYSYDFLFCQTLLGVHFLLF